ncbi:serine/threonine protein kinase [Glaciihabitans tibetensis]|uniref:non-specific serine/threonine protein kinase n=1 Tax=Glaciihabitans tibetensis TaxID=1266600 RepID=A0A2T0VAK6_9MICO|nr:serine/threonine-protein kinase [Glaciihabitans tibetensis]PRY67230.1 serine/threonine protein kinase [Glaciihabitans tibetensis]
MEHSHAGSGAAPGALIGGRYRVESLIGRGGMAAVYRAKDESLGRSVALKLFASDDAEAGALRRETSEIQLLASMNHHALVTLFDANVDISGEAERAFLVMELVEGPTLQQRIAQATVAPAEVALMTVDIGEALHAVHSQGVVHRDIKPANILLGPALSTGREFRPKLADFGIAYLIDSTRLTTPGTLIGTAAYLSPEQANGSAPGAASDIYSLGLVLLESLTGVRAFTGTMVESLTARLIRGPDIPGSLGYEWKSLLSAMTAMNPDARPTALEVADVARQISSGAATSAAPEETAPLGSGATAPLGSAATVPFDAATAPLDAATAELATPTAVLSSPATPTAVLSPAAPDAPTMAFAPADPTSATEVMPGVKSARPTSAHRTPENRTPQNPGTSKPRNIRRWVLILVLIAVLVTVGIVVWSGLASPQAPSLPSVDGDLGVHLEELMEEVSP